MLFLICVFQSSVFFFAHGNRKCAVTDLWPLPKGTHVVRFSVSAVSPVSPVNYHVVQLFLFPTWGSEGVWFFSVFECSMVCHNVLNPQPLLHPEPSFVGLSRSGRVSRVEKVLTGQFDLSLMALDCCGQSCRRRTLSEWSFASISRSGVCQLHAFGQSHHRPMHIWPHFESNIFLLSSCSDQETASHLHPSSSLRSSSNRSPLFKHLAIFCFTSKKASKSFSFFLCCCHFVSLLVRCGCGRVGSERCRCCVACFAVCLLHNAHWPVTICVREKIASSSNCALWLTTTSWPYHRRVARSPFGDCSQSFVLFLSSIHSFVKDLLAYSLIFVEIEGSIRFGCDHDHALYWDLLLFSVDTDHVQQHFASCVEVVFSQIPHVSASIFPLGSSLVWIGRLPVR